MGDESRLLLERQEGRVARNERVRDFFRSAERVDGEPDPVMLAGREAFLAALADDFNTPRAMAELYDLVAEGNKRPLVGAHTAAAELLDLLGLGSLAVVDEPVDEDAQRLVREREEARAGRDFDRADRLRDELAARGYAVRDTPQGPKLVRR